MGNSWMTNSVSVDEKYADVCGQRMMEPNMEIEETTCLTFEYKNMMTKKMGILQLSQWMYLVNPEFDDCRSMDHIRQIGRPKPTSTRI